MVPGAISRTTAGHHGERGCRSRGAERTSRRRLWGGSPGHRALICLSVSVAVIGVLLAAVPASASAAAGGAADVQHDQHGPINLTVYATGTEVSEGKEFIRTKNPELRIEASSSEPIVDIVIRVNGERRNAFHPNTTSATVTDTVDTLNSWNDITVVVRTESGAVETLEFRWLKDVIAPQLISAEGGRDRLDNPEDDDQDDSYINEFLNSSETNRLVFDRSVGTITAEFSDRSKVKTVQLDNRYTVNFAGSDQDYKQLYQTSRLNKTGENTYRFSRKIYLAPSMGDETIQNDLTINVWDKVGNHESYDLDIRVDDDRPPNGSLAIDSSINERDPEGELDVQVNCVEFDERFNNTTDDYFEGRYDGVPDCDDRSGNTSTSDTLGWVRNVSDDDVARMPGNFVRLKGQIEDETRIRSLNFTVRYVDVDQGPFCSEINDSLDQIERSDFGNDTDEQVGNQIDPDDLDYGNLSCDDLSDNLLRQLDQEDFDNVSDYQWSQFKERTELTELKDGEIVRDSATGSGEDALRSVPVNDQLLLRQARDDRVRHLINFTVTDWSGHETKLYAVVESNKIDTDTEDPDIYIDAEGGPEPLTVNVSGAVENGTVNSVSVETVDDDNNTILSHIDIYDGANTRETIRFNETLPRVENPTTIVVRANDSTGQTHVKRLGLKEVQDGGAVVTRTPTPTPTPTATPTTTPGNNTTTTVTTITVTTTSPTETTPASNATSTPGSTPVPGLAGDVTALAGPGFGAIAALVALAASAFLLTRRRRP